MKTSPIQRHSKALSLSLWSTALAVLLAACGGGGGASGSATTTTTSSSSSTTGTVNGFASVVVDGKEIEDATATTRTENADGSYTNVALKLGQRVEVTQTVHGTGTSTVTGSTTVTVRAAVIGSVSSIDTTAGEFKAAGQWVKVNSDASAGPVTAYGGGYASLASLTANDLVEVHGSAAYSSAKAAYVIQASRIDKQSTISAVRITGKVANLDTTAKSFAINGVTVKYGSATVVPTTSTLANDQTVFVWGPAGSLAGGASPVLTATRLRIATSTSTNAPVSGTGQVGGLVSVYNTSAGTFEIDGIQVSLGSATLTPAGASVANGAYVDVSGTFGSTGVLAATTVRVRQQNTATATATIRLAGAISSFVSNTSFVVRGVPVDASAITLATACPGVTLADGVAVDINATQQSGTDVVKATSMRCNTSSGQGHYTMRGVQGTAGSVDATAKTFMLTKASGTQKVQWSDQTAWGTGVTASTLSTVTNTLVVEGYLDTSSVLVARSIRVLGTADVDRYTTDGTPIQCSAATQTSSANSITASATVTSTGTSSITAPCQRGNDGWDTYDSKYRPGRK